MVVLQRRLVRDGFDDGEPGLRSFRHADGYGTVELDDRRAGARRTLLIASRDAPLGGGFSPIGPGVTGDDLRLQHIKAALPAKVLRAAERLQATADLQKIPA